MVAVQPNPTMTSMLAAQHRVGHAVSLYAEGPLQNSIHGGFQKAEVLGSLDNFLGVAD